MASSMLVTLDEMIQINKQLIVVTDLKKAKIIERKIDDLNDLIQQERELVIRLNELEVERQQQIEDASLTFSEYIEHVKDDCTRKKLRALRTMLHECMLELQEKNQVNNYLLQDAMQFVRHMVEQITKSKQQNYNYQSPLQKQSTSASTRGFFDTKA